VSAMHNMLDPCLEIHTIVYGINVVAVCWRRTIVASIYDGMLRTRLTFVLSS
jgi:hypothetical protein